MLMMMNSMMIRFDDYTDVDDDDFDDVEDDEDDDRTTTGHRTDHGRHCDRAAGKQDVTRPPTATNRTERRHDHHRRPIGPPTATVLAESPGHDVDDDSVRPDSRQRHSITTDRTTDWTLNEDCQPDHQSGHHIGRSTKPPISPPDHHHDDGYLMSRHLH